MIGMDLKEFTFEILEPYAGTDMRIRTPDGWQSLRVAAVVPFGNEPVGTRKQPFSIWLEGGEPGEISQGTFAFEHETLGTFEMFIVPRAPLNGVPQYEAAFN